MLVGEACSRDVVMVDKHDSLALAAQLMRQHHVGAVIVTEGLNGERTPLGILTDRDIVVEVIAAQIEVGSVNVADIMSTDLLTLSPESGLFEALARMKDSGIRRAPVISEAGEVIGVLALDDVLQLIAEQLLNVANLISREQRREQRSRT